MKYKFSAHHFEVWIDGKCVGAYHKDTFPNIIKEMLEVLSK